MVSECPCRSFGESVLCRSARVFVAIGLALLAAGLSPALFGQGTAPSPGGTTRSLDSQLGRLTISGSLRTRVEAWDWFESRANNSYVYNGSLLRLGLTGDKDVYDWQIELASFSDKTGNARRIA